MRDRIDINMRAIAISAMALTVIFYTPRGKQPDVVLDDTLLYFTDKQSKHMTINRNLYDLGLYPYQPISRLA